MKKKMNSKILQVCMFVLIGIAYSGCTKDEDILQQNGIKILDVKSSYASANDCTTSAGDTGTEFNFEIEIDNTKNETPYKVEVDVIYPNNTGYFSYKYSNFTVANAGLIKWSFCRVFYGNAEHLDLRFFIMTPDEKRSSFKSIRIYKPQ